MGESSPICAKGRGKGKRDVNKFCIVNSWSFLSLICLGLSHPSSGSWWACSHGAFGWLSWLRLGGCSWLGFSAPSALHSGMHLLSRAQGPVGPRMCMLGLPALGARASWVCRISGSAGQSFVQGFIGDISMVSGTWKAKLILGRRGGALRHHRLK